MPVEENKKKLCWWNVLLSILSFLAEVLFFMFELPCAIGWVVALGGTVYSRKNYKIWLNVIFLVINFLMLAFNFYFMHLMPNHDLYHIEW